MKNIYLKNIALTNYRNFLSLDLELTQKGLILLGDNGIGKTNVLEAASMCAPGTGLRKARLDSICRYGTDNWSLNCLLEGKMGEARIAILYDKISGKKILNFNGTPIPSADLVKFVDLIWLTPQAEGIFLESPSTRRRFFDRITHNFENSHASSINKYEYYLKQRMESLLQGNFAGDFLSVIEEKIANFALKIGTNRLKAVDKLSEGLKSNENDFPKALIYIEGIEKDFMAKDDSAAEESIIESLKKNRRSDAAAGRASYGIHKSDFTVLDSRSGIRAEHCSTGIQKSLLVSIITAQIKALIRETNASPILLLDELFVHLDAKRREYLVDILTRFEVQTFVTSTDIKGLENLAASIPTYHL